MVRQSEITTRLTADLVLLVISVTKHLLLLLPLLSALLDLLAMPKTSPWVLTRRSPALRDSTKLTHPMDRVIPRLLAQSALLETIVLEELLALELKPALWVTSVLLELDMLLSTLVLPVLSELLLEQVLKLIA
jgi:hypothetical protein